MYLETVDWTTLNPSISSSPWIRGEPHSRLSRLIRKRKKKDWFQSLLPIYFATTKFGDTASGLIWAGTREPGPMMSRGRPERSLLGSLDSRKAIAITFAGSRSRARPVIHITDEAAFGMGRGCIGMGRCRSVHPTRPAT